MKPALARIALVAAVVSLAACGADDNGGGADGEGDTTQRVTLGLIQRKQGGTSYFQDVAAGARAEAKANGVELKVQFTDSTDAQLSAVDSMLSSGVDGLIIGIQDPSIGPAVATKASNAGVPLLASADAFKDAQGKDVPVVTLDAKKIGQQVGDLLGEQFDALKWSDAGEATAAVSVQLPALDTCNDRTQTAASTFLAASGLPESSLVEVDYDGTLNNALTNMAAAINTHSDVQRWVVWSCNDEGVVGALKALANAGVSPDDVLGVGLGANLACDQFPKDTGFRAAVALDPKLNGKMNVDTILAEIVDGEKMPPTTMFPGKPVDPSTPASDLPC